MLSVSPGTLFPSLSPPKDFDHFCQRRTTPPKWPRSFFVLRACEVRRQPCPLHLDPFLSVSFQLCCIFVPETSVLQAWYRLVLHPMSWPDQVLKDKMPNFPLKSSVVTYHSCPPVPFPFYKLGFLFLFVSCQQNACIQAGKGRQRSDQLSHFCSAI